MNNLPFVSLRQLRLAAFAKSHGNHGPMMGLTDGTLQLRCWFATHDKNGMLSASVSSDEIVPANLCDLKNWLGY